MLMFTCRKCENTLNQQNNKKRDTESKKSDYYSLSIYY